MFCPTCGKEIPDSAPFCAFCGARFSEQPPQPQIPSRTSGMAIASFILGLLGILIITALVGLILGIVSLVQISRSHGRLRGLGFAIAGTCLSGLALLMIPILAAMLFPVIARSHAGAQKAVCLSNVKNISLAINMYMADYDDQCPPAAEWCDVLDEYVRNPEVYVCPAAKQLDCGYAYNSDLDYAGMDTIDDPMNTVAIFECDRGWNAAGLPQDALVATPRHFRGDNFGYLDGHAAWRSRSASSQSDWMNE